MVQFVFCPMRFAVPVASVLNPISEFTFCNCRPFCMLSVPSVFRPTVIVFAFVERSELMVRFCPGFELSVCVEMRSAWFWSVIVVS